MLYGVSVGRQLESASGIEGIGRPWWFSVLPVVIGIVLATVVTTRRQMGHPRREGGADEFEHRKAATLERLSALVAAVSSESRPVPADSLARLEEPAPADSRAIDRASSSRDARELRLPPPR